MEGVMDLQKLLVLSQVPGVGTTRLRALMTHFKSPAAVFEASARELIKVPGIEEKTARSILHFKDGVRFANEQLKRLQKMGGAIITFWDNAYPENLKRIYDPPPYLYTFGSFADSDKYSIAIVGTRTPSNYGKLLAEKFTAELGALGLTIVSGLARGIDTIAHSSALRKGARTTAVIGSGIDVIYPPENKTLAETIKHNGVIVSEFEMGAKPDAEHFPQRNRIISGLSLGTLVIETDVDGGAMLTARWALDQNREVFAIPGPLTEKRSAGCNLLIKRGEAKLVQSVDDILEELSTKLRPLLCDKQPHELKPLPHLTLFEKKIYDILYETPSHIDMIAEQSKLTTADALVNLLSLEFKGLVKQLPGKMFVKL
ncbi:MAG: DNA-protecting protein DprA [Ignavibacteriae bacterium]|nr:DNA-protecting protein DprA [Ignavibacteriota bacterium]